MWPLEVTRSEETVRQKEDEEEEGEEEWSYRKSRVHIRLRLPQLVARQAKQQRLQRAGAS